MGSPVNAGGVGMRTIEEGRAGPPGGERDSGVLHLRRLIDEGTGACAGKAEDLDPAHAGGITLAFIRNGGMTERETATDIGALERGLGFAQEGVAPTLWVLVDLRADAHKSRVSMKAEGNSKACYHRLSACIGRRLGKQRWSQDFHPKEKSDSAAEAHT